MKVAVSAVVVAILGLASCHPPVNSEDVRSVEDSLTGAILEFIHDLPDPLVIQNQTVLLPANDIVNGQIVIKEANVEGLTTLQVTYINWHYIGFKLELSVLYDELNLSGSFQNSLEIVSSGRTLNDNPSGTINFKGATVDIVLVVSISASPIQLKSITVQPGLDSVTVELHGIQDDEDLSQQITDAINQNGATWVNENAKAIKDAISPIVLDILNKLLADGILPKFNTLISLDDGQ